MGLFPLTPNRIKLLPPNIQKAYFDNEHVVGRYGVAGDGTCFFHSVCAALNKHNYLFKTNVEQRQIGHDFRCTFTKELTASKWDQFIEQHNIVTRTTAKQARRHFCNNKKWANEIMIRYVSATLHLNLIFIDGVNSKIYCGVKGQEYEPVIIIMWIDRTHFEPMVRILSQQSAKKNGDAMVAIQMFFDSSHDKNFIDHILEQYTTQCLG